MSLASRRRNLVRLQEWMTLNHDNLGKMRPSKRSILPRIALRRRKHRFAVLACTCLLGCVILTRLLQRSFILLCRLITWYFETHCDSEDVALWRGTHLKNMFSELKTSVNIDLVVSHCDLPIDWIFKWAAPLQFRKTYVYSKCGQPVVGAPKNTEIIRLENVGRCDHTYAHFMANFPSKTNDEKLKNSDFVMFLKDNDNSHRNHYSRHKKLKEMIPLAKEFGFACHEETNWVWSRTTPWHPICAISYYHDWDSLHDFKVEEYSRLRRDENLQFRSKSGDLLGEYAKKMGIKPQKPFKETSTAAIDENRDIDRNPIVPVCYGGNFIVQSEQILNHSPTFWERIEVSLARSNNIAEGHFMERLWGTALAKPLERNLANRILKQAHHGACRVENNHMGALSK